MDQPTRKELLYAEAEKHGVTPEQIHRAVEAIATVQRADRAAYRERTGQEMTPDQWLARYGVAEFEALCAKAARQAGLGDNGALVLRIVSSIEPAPETRADDRPVQYWARPLADPAEATFPAYRVTYEGPEAVTSPGFDWSAALLRLTLREFLHHGRGAASLEEATGVVAFTDGDPGGAYLARPAPKRDQPTCVSCGQWEREHTLHERFGSCSRFTAESPLEQLAAPVS